LDMGTMLGFLLYAAFMGAFLVYPLYSRKKILREYDGKLKSFSSVVHFFAAYALPLTSIMMAVSGIVAIFSLFKGEAKFSRVLMLLIVACVWGAVAYVYFRWRLKKLGELVPDVPAGRVLFDQCVLGLGTLDYFLLCCVFFFLSFFGVKLFDFEI